MSFFTKSKQTKGPKGGKNKFVDRKPAKRKRVVEEEEVTSSSEEEESGKGEESYESDNSDETAQAKKVRLAKAYLKEIEKQVQEREQEDDDNTLDVNGDAINKRLKEDYLRQAGKLRLTVADQYVGFDAVNTKILRCKEHKNCITCICVSTDGEYMFSGSKDGCIVKWSLKDFRKVSSVPWIRESANSNEIKGHSKAIMSIAVSHDSKFLVVGDLSSDIQIWNPQTMEHIKTLTGHRNAVTGLVFRKDTHTLYSCSKDRSVKVWSLDEMAYVETLYGHQDMITSIDALYRERAITSGGRDTSLRIWKIAEESQLIYNGPTGSIDTVRLLNEETFISGGDDGQLCIWGANKKKPLCVVKDAHGLDPSNNQPFWITSAASLLNTDLVASGSQDGFVRVWKLLDNFRNIELLFKIPLVGVVNSLVFTSDGKYLIAGVGQEHRYGRWNVQKSAKTSIVVIPLLKA